MAIQMLVTDEHLAVQGDPLSGWLDLTVTRNDNAPDSGQVQLVARPETMELLNITKPRLVVMRDGEIWTAGPIEVPEAWEIGISGSFSGGQDVPPPGEVTVNFTSDDVQPASRLVYPDPTLAASAAGQPAAYTSTANAEVLLRDLVNRNAGPGALSYRQVPGLVLGALAGVGTTTSITSRFEPMGDVMRSVALAGGDLAFGTHQVDDQIEFDVWARRDLTSTCRFSFDLGNLRSLSFTRSAPTTTTAIVGGSGEGTARTIVEVTDAAAEDAWPRVETFVDQGGVETDATGELTAAGNEALASGANPIKLSSVTVDIPDGPDGPGQIAGRDYLVTDLVTLALPTGLEIAQPVRSDVLTAKPDGGELVTCVIGSPDAALDRRTDLILRELAARLGRLEAR